MNSVDAAALYASHHKFVVGCAARRVPVDDAEDLAQDVWLRIVRSHSVFRESCKPSSWLYGITLNAARDRGRLSKRRTWGYQDAIDAATEIASDAPSAHALLVAHESDHRLTAALTTLNPLHRQTVELFLAGLSMKEISGRLGVHPGTVKSRLHRARRMLLVRMERMS